MFVTDSEVTGIDTLVSRSFNTVLIPLVLVRTITSIPPSYFRAAKHTYVNPFISWRRIDPSYVVPLSKFDSSNSQGSEKHAVVFGDTLVRNLCATSESSNLYPVFIPQKVSISP